MNWAQSTWKRHSFHRDSSGLKAAFWSYAAGRPTSLLLCTNAKALDFYMKPSPSLHTVSIWGWFYLILCWILTRVFACFGCQIFFASQVDLEKALGIGSSLSKFLAQVLISNCLWLNQSLPMVAWEPPLAKGKKPIVPCKMKPGFPHVSWDRGYRVLENFFSTE